MYQKQLDSFCKIAREYIKNIDTIVEIGARDCDETIEFSKRFPLSLIYAFECNPDTLPICREKVKNNEKIHLIEKAVSDTTGIVTFYKIDTGKTVTTHPNGNPGASSLFKASGNYPLEKYVQTEIKVNSTTLQDFIKENSIKSIDLLWMDIQGAELQALRGARENLGKIKIIHLEVEFFEIYKDQPLFEEIKKFLSENNFTFLTFTSRHKYSGDAIFVRNDIANNHMTDLESSPSYTGSKADDTAIDVVIPTISKDTEILETVLESLKHVSQKINNIYIVSQKATDYIDLCKKYHCEFIDEEKVLGYGKDQIKYVVKNRDRSGWIFQQLLKLSADSFISSKNYLAIDSDTVLVKRHSFIEGEKFIFRQSEEWNEIYFRTFEKIFGYKIKNQSSSICHMMLFNVEKVREMRSEIEKTNLKKWDQVILDLIDTSRQIYFSEFETYSNWMAIHYPQNVKFIPFINASLTRSDFLPLSLLEKKYGDKFESVSFHNYSKKQIMQTNVMNFEIKTIIFSKNRACQLEVLLRNLNFPASVIYTFNPAFESGYNKLIAMYPKVKFILETDFRTQIIECLEKSSEEFVLFLVDDDVVIRPFNENCPEFEEFKKNQDIISLSLRLAPHYEGAPKMDNNIWKWRGLRHDWGYPMSVSANIFRKQDILPIIINGSFNMPNDLEVLLRRNPPNKSLMICVSEPKIINTPANVVQTKYGLNRFGNSGISPEVMNEKFLNGQKISLDYIIEKAKTSKSCFLLTDFKYE